MSDNSQITSIILNYIEDAIKKDDEYRNMEIHKNISPDACELIRVETFKEPEGNRVRIVKFNKHFTAKEELYYQVKPAGADFSEILELAI